LDKAKSLLEIIMIPKLKIQVLKMQKKN